MNIICVYSLYIFAVAVFILTQSLVISTSGTNPNSQQIPRPQRLCFSGDFTDFGKNLNGVLWQVDTIFTSLGKDFIFYKLVAGPNTPNAFLLAGLQ